ncbi:MAG: hypothetical protein IKV16_06060, partial [Clostridia bacterium]|nr:hypothetical protein [Clostridia bacterium]
KCTPTITIAEDQTAVYDRAATTAGNGSGDVQYAYNGDGAITVKWYADHDGEQGSEIAFCDGTSQYGEQLFGCYYESLFRSTEAPYPTNQLWDRIFTASSFTFGPTSGPIEKNWTIRFSQELIKDECTYTYSVKVEFGYNSQTETAESSTSIELCTYDVHVNTTRTATLDDPNKSCYYNCSVDGDFVYGIHVKDTCDDCGSVINEFDTAVSTSSSHYYTNIEVYEGPNGFKVYIRTCPCGATRCDNGSYNDYNNNYAGVSSVNRGDYRFTSTTETITGGSVIIYTGTHNSETFIYAVESIAYYDRENCVDDSYVVLYLGCDADNYKICDKIVECKLGAMPLHKYETSTQELPMDDNPCYIKRITTSTCSGNCGRTNVYESIVAIHTPTETTKTDAKGNETYTAYCESCGYNEIIVKNANGDILRSYVESPVVVEGNLLYSITIELYTEFMGEIVPVLERCEVYEDGSKEVCVSWNETSYQYNFTSEPEKACIKTITTTVSNSNGYMGVYTDGRICCEFGEVESKIPTCKEEGYERVVCKNCGYIEYYDGPRFGEHEIWSGEVEYQERTCLQDGYERRYCANCDYFEETYYESSYGHEWMYSGDVMTTAGNSIQYSKCYRCGAYTGYNQMPISSADVMYKYNDGGDTVTVAYINRFNPDATAIEATYQIVLFLKDYDQWGCEALKVDDEGNPVVVTLEIDITDDGDGTLSFLHSDVTDAIGERDDVMVACLAVKSSDGAVTYIVFGMYI